MSRFIRLIYNHFDNINFLTVCMDLVVNKKRPVEFMDSYINHSNINLSKVYQSINSKIS